MRPGSSFSYVKNNRIWADHGTLIRLYAPILGGTATQVYQYFLAFWDDGATSYLFAHILNHLNFGMESLSKALEVLQALDLLELYEQDGVYQILLHAPLSAEEFLVHPIYRRLLEQKIGDGAVADMDVARPQGAAQAKKLESVFDLGLEVPEIKPQTESFDAQTFKDLMEKDGLRFAQEKEDLLFLAALSEQKNWTSYEVYLLAKETAVGSLISSQRMRHKVLQRPIKAEFSKQERVVIREAKAKTPLEFLAAIKKRRQGVITKKEREILQHLAQMGLLDEVINVILLLNFNRNEAANLIENYVQATASDFVAQKIYSAEAGVLRIRERAKNHKAKVEARSNVPSWSKPDYKNETSKEQQTQLEEEKRRLLAKFDQGGN